MKCQTDSTYCQIDLINCKTALINCEIVLINGQPTLIHSQTASINCGISLIRNPGPFDLTFVHGGHIFHAHKYCETE